MKIKTLVAAVASATIFASPVVFAAKENSSNGAANGQPFQALQVQIDANKALILNSNGTIADLQSQIDAINARADLVDLSIGSIETNVSKNTLDIEAALSQITTTQTGLDGVAADLAALADLHAFDIAIINDSLAGIQLELVALNTLREELAADLQAQLAALNNAVDDNALAIDSLLLNLVTINAELTGLNSSILTLTIKQNALDATLASYAVTLANLNTRVGSLESDVETLQGYHTTTFNGIQTNLPLSSLNGWSVCYSTSYADSSAVTSGMLSACNGSKIMLACRATGSDILTVAAYANREEVFLVTNTNNGVHTANGADWYFSNDWSMGFAPVGAGVTLNSADVKDTSSPQRLSWHTHASYSSGWRCGSSVGLNGNAGWEKVILEAE